MSETFVRRHGAPINPDGSRKSTLCLSRKVQESVYILVGDEVIEVIVADVMSQHSSSKVRLAIRANRSVQIFRKELRPDLDVLNG